MKIIIPLLGLILVAAQVNAKDLDSKQIYFGAGIGFNSIDDNYFRNGKNNDAVGFQIFAGLPLAVNMGSAGLAVEVGYMDTGNFDNGGSADGLWSTAVLSLPLNNNVNLLGRLGHDFGDDDGVMGGVGIGFSVARKIDMRIEYVARDHIDSLQLNLVFRQ
jgi:Outer membrane protein beta-barrel domain